MIEFGDYDGQDSRKRPSGKWLDDRDLKTKRAAERKCFQAEFDFRLGHIAWTWSVFGRGGLVLE